MVDKGQMEALLGRVVETAEKGKKIIENNVPTGVEGKLDPNKVSKILNAFNPDISDPGYKKAIEFLNNEVKETIIPIKIESKVEYVASPENKTLDQVDDDTVGKLILYSVGQLRNEEVKEEDKDQIREALNDLFKRGKYGISIEKDNKVNVIKYV